MADLTRIVNEQESFLRSIEHETRAGNLNYELITYPKGYVGVQRQVGEIAVIGEMLRKEVHNSNNLGQTYSRIRSFVSEKILGKKKLSIEELINMQLRNIMILNSNLKYINQEARNEMENLVEYYELICEEFKNNILTVPERQKRLKQKTQEFSTMRQKLSTTKDYNHDYFETEKRFRDIRRSQAEEEHDYVMRMRDTVKLQQEKAFLDVMEQLLTKSIHISEIYSRETEYIERHVDRTKNIYLRLIKQQGQFFMLRDGVEKLKEYLLNLQGGVMKGIKEMSSIVNGIDSLNAVYAPNMGSLKLIMEDVRNVQNERAIEMEKMLWRGKLLK